MSTVEENIEVNAPVHHCFEQWSKFDEFPKFMSHVQEIKPVGPDTWHWKVDGPLGIPAEWDAIMTSATVDYKISWETTHDSQVRSNGHIIFRELTPGTTLITSSLTYEPPAGALGEAIANMLSNPQEMIQQDLKNFKELLENKVAV